MPDDNQPVSSISPDDQSANGDLQDDQTTLNQDYLENSVQEAETEGTASPEDTPSTAMDTSQQAVQDDMPGDDAAAAVRDQTSPNADSFNPTYQDTQNNQVADMTSPDNGQSVTDVTSDQQEQGDISQDDPDAENRLG